jgi:orotidine-5'-phosphate decarboxylase
MSQSPNGTKEAQMKAIPLNERIIFALDVDSVKLAQTWVERLESHIRFYKVGLQLFLAGWFDIVDWILKRNHKVMLDLKFFDVPESTGKSFKTIRSASSPPAEPTTSWWEDPSARREIP